MCELRSQDYLITDGEGGGLEEELVWGGGVYHTKVTVQRFPREQ